MRRFSSFRRSRTTHLIAAATVFLFVNARPISAQTVRLKDGRMLTGKIWVTAGVMDKRDLDAQTSGEKPAGGILIVDDELRRVFVGKTRVAEVLDAAAETQVVLRPWQNPASSALRLGSVGPALNITPFDKYGRRIYEMQSTDGRLSIIQGITELSPRYAKLESLQGPQKHLSWSSSVATSSIPKETLAAILRTAIPQDDPNARLQAVRFYVQAKRFQEARAELERIIEEFPDLADLKSEAAQLRQMSARALLDELKLRRIAGQHKLVGQLLANFPADQVSGETLVQVREMTSAYEQEALRIKHVGETLRRVVDEVADPDQRGLAAPLADEIVRMLNHNTIGRLTPLVQLVDDPTLPADDKAALAISGWLLGGDRAERGLSLAIALVKAHDGVLRYLKEPNPSSREEILQSIEALDAVTPERLAALLANMRPPWHDARDAAAPGGFGEYYAPGKTDDGDFRYVVQLPPEYDPYRRYPTILCLAGAYNTPEQELDYWAGSLPAQEAGQGGAVVVRPRAGHAMRHGYIVVSVDWQKPQQYEYENSGREHVAVLTVLRDAMRRFAIDADRVYLTGHGIGGQCAWDLAQAHPDLWAGAIVFVAQVGEKYARHYWSNAEHVPLYFVEGELDGRNVPLNADVWNRYLRSPKFDVTVAEFKGRGHEPFHDEILTLFDWMGRKTRVFPPKEFVGKTLRPWDNFFWWVESEGLPPGNMMHPTDWSSRAARPAQIEGKIQNGNRLWARSPAERTTLWMNPDMVDFAKPVSLMLNNRKLPGDGRIEPEIATILEDVRTRGDRQRPFWAKIVTP